MMYLKLLVTTNSPQPMHAGSYFFNIVDIALSPSLVMTGVIGSIYCIMLSVKLAKASGYKKREMIQKALNNSIIGFVMLFLLLAALKVGMPCIYHWCV